MKFLVGVAVGSGLTASSAEQAGADFLLAINAGRMRNMGAPSIGCILPITDAGELTTGFASTEVLSQVSIPVFLGVNLFSETIDAQTIAANAAEQGFAGIVNFPTCIHLSRSMQRILARAGRGIEQEVAVLAAAKEQGLQTLFYCCDRTQARLGADAGLDKIMLNFGWNSGGQFGHRKKFSLEEVAIQARETGRLIRRIHPSVEFLLEGGPIVTADDLSFIAQKVDFDGYIGGSTIERLPMDTAITDLIASYRLAGGLPREVSSSQRNLLSWGRQCGAAGSSAALTDCLKQLDVLVGLQAPVSIEYEKGVQIDWVVSAFENQFDSDAIETIRPAIEDRHASANRRLFGTLNGDKQFHGVLGDPACELLLIHAPERLPSHSQIKLARALREGWYYVTGSHRKCAVNARCVVFSERWSDGKLPEGLEPDLAVLFNSRTLIIPALRQRPDDIAALLGFYYIKIGLTEKRQPEFSASALHRLQTCEWIGNEAELYAVADILALADCEIDKARVDAAIALYRSGDSLDLQNTRDEKTRIVEALWRHNFHKGRTAEALGISRKTLYNKITRYGL